MAKKNDEEVKTSEQEQSDKTDKRETDIVIEETEADVVLGTEFVGDTEDLKKAVKRDSEKGKVARILFPLVVFAVIAGLVGYATWYYTRPERIENTKTVEEKIQTPPVISDSKDEEPAEKVKEAVEDPEEETSTESSTDYITYTVKSGDTLSGIANEYDLTSTELADYNNIIDVHSLQIGQTIKIPQ